MKPDGHGARRSIVNQANLPKVAFPIYRSNVRITLRSTSFALETFDEL